MNEDLYLFPTFTQNYTWTKERIDRDDTDESITFQTDQGLSVNADVGISYAVDRSKVTTLFQKYRKGINEITDIYLRNMVRDALVTEASTRQIEMVYGSGKTDLLAAVEKRVRTQVEPLGINIERLYWAGEFRLPQTVTTAIDAKIKAAQFAQQRANEVAAAKAEADKAIEEARGVAESTLLRQKPKRKPKPSPRGTVSHREMERHDAAVRGRRRNAVYICAASEVTAARPQDRKLSPFAVIFDVSCAVKVRACHTTSKKRSRISPSA